MYAYRDGLLNTPKGVEESSLDVALGLGHISHNSELHPISSLRYTSLMTLSTLPFLVLFTNDLESCILKIVF